MLLSPGALALTTSEKEHGCTRKPSLPRQRPHSWSAPASFARKASTASPPGTAASTSAAAARPGGGDFDNALAKQGIGASSSNDRSDTSLGFNVGYLVNRNFAIEGAYTRLGEFDYSAAASSPAADTITGKYKAHALSLSGVGILPLQQNWSVYGKAGLARTKTDLEASSATGAVAVGNSSDSRTGLLIGAGAMYDISRNVFARAGWDRYADIGSDATGKGHADVYSIGVGYRF